MLAGQIVGLHNISSVLKTKCEILTMPFTADVQKSNLLFQN